MSQWQSRGKQGTYIRTNIKRHPAASQRFVPNLYIDVTPKAPDGSCSALGFKPTTQFGFAPGRAVLNALARVGSPERLAADHHPWPAGSIFELLKIIGPLTDPPVQRLQKPSLARSTEEGWPIVALARERLSSYATDSEEL